jgi:hypothetical protein
MFRLVLVQSLSGPKKRLLKSFRNYMLKFLSVRKFKSLFVIGARRKIGIVTLELGRPRGLKPVLTARRVELDVL